MLILIAVRDLLHLPSAFPTNGHRNVIYLAIRKTELVFPLPSNRPIWLSFCSARQGRLSRILLGVQRRSRSVQGSFRGDSASIDRSWMTIISA